MDPIFIGQVMLWPTIKIPYGWAVCNGQELPINQYQALYTIIQNTYGTPSSNQNFKLPNFAGITLAGSGTPQAPLTQKYSLNATVVGSNTVALDNPNMVAQHSHVATYNLNNSVSAKLLASTAAATLNNVGSGTNVIPAAGVMSDSSVSANLYGPATASPVQLTNALSVSLTATMTGVSVLPVAGQSVPHSNLQPYISFMYLIAWDGTYPPFN